MIIKTFFSPLKDESGGTANRIGGAIPSRRTKPSIR